MMTTILRKLNEWFIPELDQPISGLEPPRLLRPRMPALVRIRIVPGPGNAVCAMQSTPGAWRNQEAPWRAAFW